MVRPRGGAKRVMLRTFPKEGGYESYPRAIDRMFEDNYRYLTVRLRLRHIVPGHHVICVSSG